VDFISVFAATGLMLICEMFNTTIEALCDFVETRQNEKVRVIKEIAAAATGISILIWAVVMVTELGHLWSFVVNVFLIINLFVKWVAVLCRLVVLHEKA
jgi:diacylglycerol kinase (ATP)